MIKVTCSRCGGGGFLPQYKYNGGQCYGCGGSGYVWKENKKRAPKAKNNIEYIAYHDEAGNVVYVHKLEKKMSEKKAIQEASKIIPNVIYQYYSLCTDKEVEALEV